MKMIILNGSPKKNIKESNTEIFINQFLKDTKNKYPIKYIAKEDPIELSKSLKEFDTILIFLPLYIHAMPGIVMKFLEKLEEKDMKGKNIGFFIQAGFPETAQEQFVERYFEELTKQLKCKYLGTVSKGEAAAVYMYPKKFKKLYRLMNELGRKFEETNNFDESIVKKLSYQYNLSDFSKFIQYMLKITYKLKISDFSWNMMLKRNNSFDKRADKPFN